MADAESEFDTVRRARENMERIKYDHQKIRMEIKSIQEQFEQLCEAHMRSCDIDVDCLNELVFTLVDSDDDDVMIQSNERTSSLCDEANNSNNRFHGEESNKSDDVSIIYDWADFRSGSRHHSTHSFNSDDERSQVMSYPGYRHSVDQPELYDWNDSGSSDDVIEMQHYTHIDPEIDFQQEGGLRTTYRPRSIQTKYAQDDTTNKSSELWSYENKSRRKLSNAELLSLHVDECPHKITQIRSFQSINKDISDFDFDYPNYQPNSNLTNNTDEAGESMTERFIMEDMEREIDSFFVKRNNVGLPVPYYRIQHLDYSSANLTDRGAASDTRTNTCSLLSKVSKLNKPTDQDMLNANTAYNVSCKRQKRKKTRLQNKIRTFSQSTLLMNQSVTMLTNA